MIFIMVILLAGLQIEGLDTREQKSESERDTVTERKKGDRLKKGEKDDINVVRLARDFGICSTNLVNALTALLST